MAKKQNKDALIQTRVPKKLADYAQKAAERDGISVAAWLRRLVMRDMDDAKYSRVNYGPTSDA